MKFKNIINIKSIEKLLLKTKLKKGNKEKNKDGFIIIPIGNIIHIELYAFGNTNLENLMKKETMNALKKGGFNPYSIPMTNKIELT